MQISGSNAYRRQTDFVPEVKREGIGDYGLSAQESGTAEKRDALQQEETYQPTEEGLIQLYMEQLEQQRQSAENEQEACNEELKVLRIALNIMRGKKVPAKDESFLLTKNYKMYMAAKNMAMMRKSSGKAKSVLDDAKTSDSVSSPRENDGEGSYFMNNTYSTFNGSPVVQVTTSSSGSKARKRFFYNFKDVSARLLSARTSGGARQVLASARQKTAQLRRKLKSGEYDEETVQLALTHAEAMERVAQKKMKHLQEEETGKRGGVCVGSNDRELIEEQMRQDEQLEMERQTAEETFDEAGMPFDSMSVEELMANVVKSDMQMLDLVSSMDEFVEEFSELMEDSMEEINGLSELAEELLGENATPDMDPEDLKAMKLKHRTEEQRKIAEADSKYLKALFQKLQREQQAAAQGAAKFAEAVPGGSGGGVLSLAGTAAGGTAHVSAGAPSEGVELTDVSVSVAAEAVVSADISGETAG